MNDRLRAVFCDHLSIMRGKYLPHSKIGDNDTRFCRSTFGVHYDKDLLPAPGAMMMEGLPDMELRWQGDDIRECWESGTKIVLGDLFDTDGAPLPMCPRGALRVASNAARCWCPPRSWPSNSLSLFFEWVACLRRYIEKKLKVANTVDFELNLNGVRIRCIWFNPNCGYHRATKPCG